MLYEVITTTSRVPVMVTGAEVKIGGIIGSVRQKTTKQGKKMAYLQSYNFV